eukprot:8869848-Alexandrium_andersonii.AAC.1
MARSSESGWPGPVWRARTPAGQAVYTATGTWANGPAARAAAQAMATWWRSAWVSLGCLACVTGSSSPAIAPRNH